MFSFSSVKCANKVEYFQRLVMMIVQSKRLLVDHVEELELCNIERHPSILTPSKFCGSFGLMSISLCSLKLNYKP